MKRQLVTTIVVGILSLNLGGCAGGASKPLVAYKPTKVNKIIKGTEGGYIVRNLKNVYGYYEGNSYLDYQVLDNLDSRKIHTNYKYSAKPMFIGQVDRKVYYTYSKGMFSKDAYFEVLDKRTNKTHTLFKHHSLDNKRFQILQYGSQVVLKLSKPTRYISLNTLQEVKGVSSHFRPIKIGMHGDNITGSRWHDKIDTMSLFNVRWNIYEQAKYRNVTLLF